MIRNRINNNTLAIDVAKREGGNEVNIADIKEVQKITFEELVNNHESIDILNMLERYRK